MSKVIAAVDTGRTTHEVIRAGLRLASETGSELLVVGAVRDDWSNPPPAAGERLRNYRTINHVLHSSVALAREQGVPAQALVRVGDVANVALEEAKNTGARDVLYPARESLARPWRREVKHVAFRSADGPPMRAQTGLAA